MKKSYTFSNLPMAAIVLLVASLPCLAQVTLNESSSALAADNGSTLAMNKTFRRTAVGQFGRFDRRRRGHLEEC